MLTNDGNVTADDHGRQKVMT